MPITFSVIEKLQTKPPRNRYELFELLQEFADLDCPEPSPTKIWNPLKNPHSEWAFKPSQKLRDQRAFKAIKKIVDTRKYPWIPIKSLYEKYAMLAAEYGSINFYYIIDETAKFQSIDIHKDPFIMYKRISVAIKNNHIEIMNYIVNHCNVFLQAYRLFTKIQGTWYKQHKEMREYLHEYFSWDRNQIKSYQFSH
jgi:hypothetical protein